MQQAIEPASRSALSGSGAQFPPATSRKFLLALPPATRTSENALPISASIENRWALDVFGDRQSPADLVGFVKRPVLLGKQGLLRPGASGTSAGAGRTSAGIDRARRGLASLSPPVSFCSSSHPPAPGAKRLQTQPS